MLVPRYALYSTCAGVHVLQCSTSNPVITAAAVRTAMLCLEAYNMTIQPNQAAQDNMMTPVAGSAAVLPDLDTVQRVEVEVPFADKQFTCKIQS